MVVGQRAAVDLGVPKTGGIFRAHAVIDALWGAITAAGHRRFKVDDARIRLHPRQLLQCSAPDVGWPVSPRNEPIRLLGEQNVILGRAYVIFVDLWAARVCQYLVDTAATHDVAAQEKPQRFATCGQVSVLIHEIAPQLVCVNAAITSASKRCSSPA